MEYKHTKTTVSMINYHFIFCPRYRRKVFDIPGVEDRFKELVREACKKKDIDILAMECHHDHVHMFVNALPKYSPADIMNCVKGATSRKLRDEFQVLSRMPNMWTRSYFCSTAGEVSSETIRRYVEAQKTK